METCGTCQHVQALHAGRTGNCRLNGCPCGEFRIPAPEPVPTVAVAAPRSAPAVSVEAFTAILTGIAFVAGVLVGMNL